MSDYKIKRVHMADGAESWLLSFVHNIWVESSDRAQTWCSCGAASALKYLDSSDAVGRFRFAVVPHVAGAHDFLDALLGANTKRQQEWDPSGRTSEPLYVGLELLGEAGEAGNIIKKLERERLGVPGSRATVGALAAELADVLICLARVAAAYGIDLKAATTEKFNLTSAKVGLKTML